MAPTQAIAENRVWNCPWLHRRHVLKLLSLGAGQFALALSPFASLIRAAWAEVRKRLLPADTRLDTLLFEDPDKLDPRNLPVTPISQFKTMGLTTHEVDLSNWRLEIDGAVSRPLKLSYRQIEALPFLEHNVLLICPGVFAYYAHWKGVSIWRLLNEAGLDQAADYVDVRGPAGPYEKVERFPIAEIKSDRVFLAYGVNGESLPQKHGFPLRAVAEGYVGSDWVKFVYKIEAVITGQPAESQPKPQQPAFLP